MVDPPPTARSSGLSLYADLLDPTKSSGKSTISSAPVRYNLKAQEAPEAAQKKKDASLQFQPVKRPQVQAKGRSRNTGSTPRFPANTVSNHVRSSSPAQVTDHNAAPLPRSTFEDWVGDEDEEISYQKPKWYRQSKKKKNRREPARTWDWDDIYDPSIPNSYADYKGSEEQVREIRDWKARLYYHQLKAIEHESKSQGDSESERAPVNPMFAPPPNLNFAPPCFDRQDFKPGRPDEDDDGDVTDYYSPDVSDKRAVPETRPSFAPVPDDVDGDEAYARRAQMSSSMSNPGPELQQVTLTRPSSDGSDDMAARKADALTKLAAMKAKLDLVRPTADQTSTTERSSKSIAAESPPEIVSDPLPPPPQPEDVTSNAGIGAAGTISREPVRYNTASFISAQAERPDVNMIDAAPEEEGNALPDQDKPRTNRPGQKGFAERLLRKYGWEKGQGLGAQGDGITTAIVAKADKRKKNSDAEGGGWAMPRNMGKIVGGKKRKLDGAGDQDQQPDMSEVVRIKGMLSGLDVDHEVQENNLMQRIGDEFGQKYGTVERLFIWTQELGGNNEVFIKFTSQLSALRTVNATDIGQDAVVTFYDSEKFNNGQYA